MMGACGSGPTAGVENGFLCSRSTDVWGIALDTAGELVLTWPGGDLDNSSTSFNGTYVTTQNGGPVIGVPTVQTPEVPWAPGLVLAGVGLVVIGVRRRGSRIASSAGS